MRNAYTITGDTLRIFVSNFITLRPSSSLTRDSARALIGCTLQSVVLCSARPKLSQVRTMHLLSKHVTRENIVVDAPVKSRVRSSQWVVTQILGGPGLRPPTGARGAATPIFGPNLAQFWQIT